MRPSEQIADRQIRCSSNPLTSGRSSRFWTIIRITSLPLILLVYVVSGECVGELFSEELVDEEPLLLLPVLSGSESIQTRWTYYVNFILKRKIIYF